MAFTDPEVQSRIAIWRQKAADGTLTTEEMRGVIEMLRGPRASAAVTSATSRTRARKEVKSAEDLLGELGNL